MMRVAVVAARARVAAALVEKAGPDLEIITLSRQDVSLEDRDAVLAGVKAARPNVVINAADYTAVDRAECEADLAMRVNAPGAGHVAETAASTGAPLLHLSTDYVFVGALETGRRSSGRQVLPERRDSADGVGLQSVRRLTS